VKKILPNARTFVNVVKHLRDFRRFEMNKQGYSESKGLRRPRSAGGPGDLRPRSKKQKGTTINTQKRIQKEEVKGLRFFDFLPAFSTLDRSPDASQDLPLSLATGSLPDVSFLGRSGRRHLMEQERLDNRSVSIF
jgi:hypothetical protein